ncbi:MAG: trypsin-like serine protease, partial [Myxococcota bacterium]|nr:trypsin-like serine protease [Myxococcota bacterium]
MPIVRLSVVLLGLSGVASACEAALDDIGAGGAGLPIVDGTRETGETAVVLIYHDRGAMCSATAISPRVVVTAKHCVQGMRADGWRVFVGSSPIRIIDEYRVTATRTTPGTGIENADIAVMLLAEDFEYELKRWEFTPWPRFGRGSVVTSIGFGQTNPGDGNSAGTKYRRDGYVRWLSGTREYVTDDNNVCSGDSGGPSLFEDVLVGVASRGEEGCLGMGIMTRLSGFYDLIATALRDTGGCVPTSFEVCDGVDNDCWGTIDDDLPNCRCAGGGSPAPETCNRIDDDCNNAIDDLANCACRAGAPPGEEVCNGIDDDCDEQIDEVCLRLGAPCSADSECASLLCDEVDGARICTAPCTSGVGPVCLDGGYCRGAACEPDGLCVPADGAGDALLGTRCTGNGECRSRFCEPTGGRCSLPCVPGALACPATLACLAIG